MGCEMNHAIDIPETNQEFRRSMRERLCDSPKLLNRSSGTDACCIFRIPQSFHEVNGSSYKPQAISIGPYHRGEAHLEMIQEHKWLYLRVMLERIQWHNVQLEDLIDAIWPLERQARECYSQDVHMDGKDFVEMMVLDGCFILELFRKVGDLVKFDKNDPIKTMSWVRTFLARDLLKLENQIPYFILHTLYERTKAPDGDEARVSLSLMALHFFNFLTQRPENVIWKFANLEGKHLLDLVRRSYIDGFFKDSPPVAENKNPANSIHPISKLRRSGIKLKQIKVDSFLVVRFKHGFLEMPALMIDDFMRSFISNCIVYEQCQSGASTHFTTYTSLLDWLVNTARDVEYLCERNIFENCLGSDEEVVQFINSLGKEVALNRDACYLADVLRDVRSHYQNKWHVGWAGFKSMYFKTPWSFISALAAAILLLLTMAQTFYTIYGVYNG